MWVWGGVPGWAPPSGYISTFFSDSEFELRCAAFHFDSHYFAMPIVPPEDFDDAVQPLPEDQFPYGKNCRMGRGIQAILFHYKILAKAVENLQIEEFFSLRDF